MTPAPLFMVGVDTEADDQWSLEGRKRLSVENALALPRLQRLCEAYGVRPSYLVTHEMATRDPARKVLRDLAASGRCEIGAHLHPWSSPPYREEDLIGRYPSQLDDSLLLTQLSELTTAIESSLGVRPVSYRAGRHGFDTRSLRILETLGYRVDTSVDPLFNETRKGGPSFAGAPVAPYWPSHEDVRAAGTSVVLEIPVSAATTPSLPRWLEKSFTSLPSIPWRGYLKRLGIRARWLRPSYSSVEDATSLASALVARGVPTLNMLFHSSELVPGGSPYNKDAADVDRFFVRLERVFEHVMKGLGARGVTYRECADSPCLAPARPLRVLMVTPHLPPYQAANALLPHVLGEELEKRKHSVSFLTFETSGPEREGAAYVKRRTAFRFTRIPQLLEMLETRHKALPLVQAADVVHVHSNTWMNQVAAGMATAHGKPYVLTHYGTEIWHHDGRNHAFKVLNKNARHVTFYSQALLARALELNVPIRASSVVYPAVDLMFSPLPPPEREAVRAPLVSSSESLLFNVKRLHPLADHATLLRAFALLDPTLFPARLVIAGSGEERERLEDLAQTLGISSRVRFLGLVPNRDVARLHGAADLFVLSSRLEATPTVVLEALACGTRVVSTDNPGGVELGSMFQDDLRIVPRENPQALADGIAASLRENRRASEKTSRVVDERFSLRGLVDRYCEIYQEALR